MLHEKSENRAGKCEIDHDWDPSISPEQPLSLQKSEAMPEEVVFLDPALENRVKLLGRGGK